MAASIRRKDDGALEMNGASICEVRAKLRAYRELYGVEARVLVSGTFSDQRDAETVFLKYAVEARVMVKWTHVDLGPVEGKALLHPDDLPRMRITIGHPLA